MMNGHNKNMVLAGLFAALLAIGSQISIPIGPVPVTFQVPIVLLAGIVLGPRMAAVSVGVWILLGSFGLPVFAQGKAGLSVLVGPTGGFLFGFLAGAWTVGLCTAGESLTYWKTIVAMLLGLTVIYGLGYIGFMASFTWFLHKPMTLEKGLQLAVLPFVPLDALKAVLAAYLGVRVRQALVRAGLVCAK